MRIAVLGYGILGRLVAWRMAQSGHAVSVFESSPAGSRDATSFAAGGMLAPYSELDSSEASIKDLGLQGLTIWESYRQILDLSGVFFDQGSLIVSHARDKNLLLEFEDRIKSCESAEAIRKVYPHDIEPELNESLSHGVFIPEEKHLIPDRLLEILDLANKRLGVALHWQHKVDLNRNNAFESYDDYSWIIDCRGLGARDFSFSNIRGVRGEAILLHAPNVCLQRPVRIMHPRYAVYIVPRGNSYYYLGATQIESEAPHPITVRSSLELLSAAFVAHSGFAEASIERMTVGLRPALPSNHPKLLIDGKYIALNGLYRHGYLLSPLLVEAAFSIVSDHRKPSFFEDLIVS
jgi:glycine oxidase